MSLSSQERLLVRHFAQYVSDHKKEFIQKVLDAFDPFDFQMNVLQYPE